MNYVKDVLQFVFKFGRDH